MLAVTGVTGLIGTYALPRLTRPYRALVRNPLSARPHADDVLGDMQHTSDLERLVSGCDTLLHLACSSNPRTSGRDIPADIMQNLVSGVRLFETFYRHNPLGHILFVSTGGGMYANQSPTLPIPETAPARPWSSYAVHKLALEQYLGMLAKQSGGSATVLRIGNPYGAPLPSRRGQGLIGVALTLLKEGKTLDIIEHPETVRDYLHMDDVAAAFDKALQSKPASGALALYHIGSGKGHSIGQVIESINRVTGKKLSTRILSEAQSGAPTYNVLDCGKARAELGWECSLSLEEGLSRMWHGIRV